MIINLNKILFRIYSFLFIFTMINREFLFFGVDLRYIILLLGMILVLLSFTNICGKKEYLPNRTLKIYRLLFLLFFWSLLSNISWLWNGLDRFPTEILNQNILIFNNLIALIVFKRFNYYIEEEKLKRAIIFSCFVLTISFILTKMGYSLSQISGSNVRSMVQASEKAAEHKNLFGGNYRLSGYAEDPNYASLFLVLGVITALQLKNKKKVRYFISIVFSLAFCFSCSKTILLSFLFGFSYLFCYKLLRKKRLFKVVNFCFCLCIVLIIFILPVSGLLSSHTTMTTRFRMWNMAKELFFDSPIIGNGINAFKSYINAYYGGSWYVQPHSTYWQLLSETGIIGFLIYIAIIINCLDNNISKYNKYLLFIFFIFVINFETIQLQVFVYIVFVLNCFFEKRCTFNEKKSFIYN